MEIVKLPKGGINIKGKNALIAVDPKGKTDASAVLLLNEKIKNIDTESMPIIISGPGEYEISGVIITCRSDAESLIYSMSVDGVDVLLGNVEAVETVHSKLKEHNLVVVNCEKIVDATSITPLVSNAIVCFGEKAGEIASAFGKEGVQKTTKYQIKAEKLPVDVETVILE